MGEEGKLKYEDLEYFIGKYKHLWKDKNLILGPSVGEDAVVLDNGKNYEVIAMDPITFTEEDIGYYVLHINANDVATMGAVPEIFIFTTLIPTKAKKSVRDIEEKVFEGIEKARNELMAVYKELGHKINLKVIPQHTEITSAVNKTTVTGLCIGYVEKNKLVRTGGAELMDSIILTKNIPIEGTVIIAKEKADKLDKLFRGMVKRAKDYIKDLSIVKDALIANRYNIHAMHDVTEGGLINAVYEIAKASKRGAGIDYDSIPVLEECNAFCKYLNMREKVDIEPLGLIGSGSLLITADKRTANRLVKEYEKNDIKATIIGEIIRKDFLMEKDGKLKTFKPYEKDEITKIF